ncbi:restriction endonuclease subunit S [Vibrio cholerae]
MSLNSRDTSAGKTNEEHKYKQTEVGLIPVDWDVCDLQDAVDFLDGMRRPVKSGDRAKISGVFPYYGASGIVDYVNDYIFDDELILLGEDGENILSRNLPLAFKVSGKIWVNNHAHVLKPKSSFDITFLTEFLESLDYSLLNSGTAQPKLNKKSCLKIKIAKPALEEQTAIANALSDVDALIQELEKLIAKKQAIKTATMQQLLTGRTRLPQFAHHPDGRKKGYKPSELGEIPEDWEVVNLGEISAITKLAGFEYTNYFNSYRDGGDIIVIRGTNITENFLDLNDIKTIPRSTSNMLPRSQLNAGDLVFAYVGTVGPVFLIREDNKYHLGPNTAKITCNNTVVSEFLRTYFTSELIKIQIDEHLSIGAQPSLSMGKIRSFKIVLPCSKDEQIQIDMVISSMEEEMQSLKTRINKTRQIKQGMMQELLTGKTRLIKPAGAA